LIEIYKTRPPKKTFKPLIKYQNVKFKKKFSIKLINDFFEKFPEEKRGRKNFKKKEILNIKSLLYNQIMIKGLKLKADCFQIISEKVIQDTIIISISFFKKND